MRLGPDGREAIVQPMVDRLRVRGLESVGDVDDARESIDRLHREGVRASLSDAQMVRLEALVSLTERPVLRVSLREDATGRVQTLDADDPALGRFGGLVNIVLPDLEQTRLGSVGRIDGDGVHSGTGFVVGDGIVITNRHVAETIASPLPRAEHPSRWLLHTDATINFSPEADDPAQRFAIIEVIFAGPNQILGLPIDYSKLDLALLKVAKTNAVGRSLPPVVPLIKAAGLALQSRNLFVIGYPAAPTILPRDEKGMIRRDVVGRLRELFGINYGRKYFSPGIAQTLSTGWVFDHDATTLGGEEIPARWSAISAMDSRLSACTSPEIGSAPITRTTSLRSGGGNR